MIGTKVAIDDSRVGLNVSVGQNRARERLCYFCLVSIRCALSVHGTQPRHARVCYLRHGAPAKKECLPILAYDTEPVA